MKPPYPLQWPDNIKRSEKKASSQFRTGLPGAMKNVQDSLRKFSEDSRFKISGVSITSNAALGQMEPQDGGVAVWFDWDGEERCIAVDRYRTVQENLQAIHHVIEARRTELRHAGIEVVRATFRGFSGNLLNKPNDPKDWRSVFNIREDEIVSFDTLNAMFKRESRGASEARQKELNTARDQARKELT